MRVAAIGVLAAGLCGCIGIFAPDFEVDYEAELVSVQTVDGQSGPMVDCTVLITATAVGDEGEEGKFGEASFAYRSLATGAYLDGERRSSAFMGSRFGSEVIKSGETRSTELSRATPEPFEWQMQLFFRRPGGTRGDEEFTIRCAP